MKKNFFIYEGPSGRKIALGLILTCLNFGLGYAQTCDAPTGLKGSASGYLVNLSWDLAPRGNALLDEGFESETFPPDGWSVQTKNRTNYAFTWFQFPTEDFQNPDTPEFIYDGEKDACVYMDLDEHADGSSANQDEWLITPEIDGAVYLDFWSHIDPMILEYGKDENFPDHYYVKVSHDNGATWEAVWDARYDSYGTSGWEFVSLKVGKKGQKTKIAFQAISNQEDPLESLYFMWNIDNVRISDAEESQQSTPFAYTPKAVRKTGKALSKGTPAYRPYHSKTGIRVPARSVQTKVDGIDSYKIYRNDELIADGIRTNWYVDTDEKTPGNYTYKVKACCVDCGLESEPAATTVEVKEALCNPPTNVRVTVEPDEEKEGTYITYMYWDAPQGDRAPDFYNCYVDGSIFSIEAGEEDGKEGMGQSEMPEGVYSYAVEAVYSYPDGTSERIMADAATLNERYPVRSVTIVNSNGNSAEIAWEPPVQTNGHTIEGYNLYCGDKQIARNQTGTSYIYNDIPVGIYECTVRVLYTDGVESTGKSATLANGEMPVYDLDKLGNDPFSEDFSNGLLPGNWRITNEMTEDPYAMTWKVKDLAKTDVKPGSLLNGGIAIIESEKAGFWCLGQNTSLITPPLTYNSDAEVLLYLDFDYDYPTNGKGSEVTLSVSADQGANWEQLETLEGTATATNETEETSAPRHYESVVNKYFGDNKKVMFRWNFTGSSDAYLALDNISVGTTPGGSINTAKAEGNLRVDKGTLIADFPNCSVKSLTVFSCEGKQLLGNREQNTLPVASLGRGIYLVRIITDNGMSYSKIVIR